MPEITKIILLADDDPEDQEILEDVMTKLDATVKMHKVDGGKQAVDYLLSCPKEELPCLIILDLLCGFRNTVTLYSPFLKARLYPGIPATAMSNKRMEHEQSYYQA